MSPPSVMNRIFVSLLSTYNWNTRNILPYLALDENVVMQWELVRIWFDKKPLSNSLHIPSRVDEVRYRIFRISNKPLKRLYVLFFMIWYYSKKWPWYHIKCEQNYFWGVLTLFQRQCMWYLITFKTAPDSFYDMTLPKRNHKNKITSSL